MLTPDRTPTSAVDTVVIGGGLAGLVAANHLADSGTTVTVIEARSAVGGRASTTERDGFLVNEGPHALYRGGVGAAALGELGIEAAGGMPSVTKSYGLSNGRVSCLPASFMTLLRTKLVPLSLKPKLAITMAGLSKVEPSELATTTVTQWIEATTANPEMRSLLHALSRLATYSHAPELLSAEIAVRQIQMAMKDNVLYLDGGWQQLVTALANRAAAAGATITTGVKVTAIGSVQNGWVVETDGGQIAAQAVIAAAGGPEQAESWFGLGPGKLTRAAGPKVQAAVLDVLLKRLPERRFVLGIDEPVYFSHQLAAPVVDIEAAPTGSGFWLVAADGGVFAFGTAAFHGSAAGLSLRAPIAGMAATIDGNGYWLTFADGGVFSFGSAQFHGGATGIDLVGPIVGIATTPDGGGYWLAGSDGGVFSYGSAPFFGSAFEGGQTSEVTGVAVPSADSGYWLVTERGLVPTFGPPVLFAAAGRGTAGVVVDVAATPDGGYVIAVDPGDLFERFVASLSPGREETWNRIAHCESTGRWDINTGNGYYGGIQFKLSSWRAVGGQGWPHEATREEQIFRGELLLEIQGWRAWPTCSRKLGLR